MPPKPLRLGILVPPPSNTALEPLTQALISCLPLQLQLQPRPARRAEIAPAMERHLGVAKNTQIGLIGEDVLDGLVEEVVQGTGVEAVATFCTNWTAVQRVETWEEKWGLPVFDTVSVGVWDMLMMAGFGMKDLKGWGSLFQKS